MKKQEAKNNKIEEKVIDAEGKALGRVATEIAMSLMGKDKPSYQREAYKALLVTVLNSSRIKITDKKLHMITHANYSGHRGGLRITKAKDTVVKKGFPELIKLAVYRMLPSNKLRPKMMKNLKIKN